MPLIALRMNSFAGFNGMFNTQKSFLIFFLLSANIFRSTFCAAVLRVHCERSHQCTWSLPIEFSFERKLMFIFQLNDALQLFHKNGVEFGV